MKDVLNPLTLRFVKADGKIGRKLRADFERAESLNPDDAYYAIHATKFKNAVKYLRDGSIKRQRSCRTSSDDDMLSGSEHDSQVMFKDVGKFCKNIFVDVFFGDCLF